MTSTDFVPRWASPPGDTIKEALSEQRLESRALAASLELPDETFEAFLSGEIPLTIRLAERLASMIGGSVEFWMTRDGQYRADRSRVMADEWAQRMPVKDMMSLGWIATGLNDWVERIEACLDFFGVADAEVWQANHEALIQRARFRRSPAIATDDFAVAAWLRRCDLELSQISCRGWDADAFEGLLPQLLPLTRERDPQVFLPELRARCADAGVAVGVVRAPRGCPVSGATLPLANGQPSIALSARHLSDDHLWFTFFHEAAHLVLHGTGALYLDEIEREVGLPLTADEAEADQFAGRLLVPAVFEAGLVNASPRPFKLRGVADAIGVSPGIVVGYLQHRGVLGYNTRLNKLKRRYKWNGPSLEIA